MKKNSYIQAISMLQIQNLGFKCILLKIDLKMKNAIS